MNEEIEKEVKQYSYELRRNNEIVLFWRKDIVSEWAKKAFWTILIAVVSGAIGYLWKSF